MTGARSYAVQGAAGLELARLRQFTPARIALGRAGTGVPTTASLQFMLDHAKARDAMHRALDFAQLGEAVAARGWRVAHVRSAAQNRAEYLRRPDLGRRLANEARPTLEALAGDPDVAIVAADGLSATAIAINLQPLLDHLMPRLLAAKRAVGPIVLVEQGRVAVGTRLERYWVPSSCSCSSASDRGFPRQIRSAATSPGIPGLGRWTRRGIASPTSAPRACQ